MSSKSSNITNVTDSQLTVRWSAVPAAELAITVITIIGNGLTLVTFVCNRRLLTPFNIYVVNLLITNLLNALLLNSLDIVNDLFPRWPLSFAHCTFFNYCVFALGAGMHFSHTLITLDRLWSVLLPVSYRCRRSPRTSIMLCCGMWLYINAIIIPGIIVEAAFYRIPLDTNRCSFNSGKPGVP